MQTNTCFQLAAAECCCGPALFQPMALCRGWDSDRICIENTDTDKPRTLYQGTQMGEAPVITKCDRIEILLPVTDIMMTGKTLRMKAGCETDVLNTAPPSHTKGRLPFDLHWLKYVWILQICQNTCNRLWMEGQWI